MQDIIIKCLVEYARQHGWSESYIKAAAPDIAMAIILNLEKEGLNVS